MHEAALALRRVELTRRSMTSAMLSYPAAGLVTLARIYSHAARLRLKGLQPVAAPVSARRTTRRRGRARPGWGRAASARSPTRSAISPMIRLRSKSLGV